MTQLYAHCLPPCVRALKNLAAVLKKGEAFAEAKKIEQSVLLNDRLAPDMFALTRQVQIACDVSKGAASRLSGSENPSFPDSETSFAQLYARIDRTIDFLHSVPESAFAGSETRTITLQTPFGTMEWNGLDYVNSFVLPNVYFHSSMAYAILRNNGVELGKQDFLAGGG